MNKYRTPTFDEMKPGFKCETCYCWFTSSHDDNWVDLEFTEETYDKYIDLIRADAYETEFRVKL